MTEVIISGQALEKQYPGGTGGWGGGGGGGRGDALRGLDIEVARGAVHALLGPNGAGKTTAIRILAGLVRRTGGRAEVLGADPWLMPLDVRRRVGFLAARPSAYPWLTVGETIDHVAGLRGDGFDRPAASALARRLDLDEAAIVSKLSLGTQRKLGLLIAVAPRPDVLLLDEPASGLDPLARREMLEIVLELVRAHGTTVLYSTHILSDVERVATDVTIVARGRTVLSRPLDELKEGVRRLRLTFDAPAETERIRAAREVLDVRAEAREALVVADLGGGEGADAALAARLGGRLEASAALDLEEIYVTLMKEREVRG